MDNNKEPDAVVLLIDENRGIYIPQNFCENFDISDWQISDEDAAICIAGPDHEWYWEAWDNILQSAKHIKWGHTLDQDGALWAMNYERMTCEERKNFDWHDGCDRAHDTKVYEIQSAWQAVEVLELCNMHRKEIKDIEQRLPVLLDDEPTGQCAYC